MKLRKNTSSVGTISNLIEAKGLYPALAEVSGAFILHHNVWSGLSPQLLAHLEAIHQLAHEAEMAQVAPLPRHK